MSVSEQTPINVPPQRIISAASFQFAMPPVAVTAFSGPQTLRIS